MVQDLIFNMISELILKINKDLQKNFKEMEEMRDYKRDQKQKD